MESDELKFKNIGLSSDGTVIFCAMDNGKTYAMPLCALDKAEDWDPSAKPKAARIIHDGYAALVKFDNKVTIDFPADFVLHVCEPSYPWFEGKSRTSSGVATRIREIRKIRRMTLDALAAKCGIAKPNLSRLENSKVRPKFETLQAIAAALNTSPALLTQKDAWTWTLHHFSQWELALSMHDDDGYPRGELVTGVEMVRVFLATWPEHRYARQKLLKHANRYPEHPDRDTSWLNQERWATAKTAAQRAMAK
jgi:transcriptional regulator with XRE-family HTH domain